MQRFMSCQVSSRLASSSTSESSREIPTTSVMLSTARGNEAHLSLLDGLRGLAALAVVLFHYRHFFMVGPSREKVSGFLDLYPAQAQLRLFYESGYFAVQIFWMISGFVFAHVYLTRAISTQDFYINRIARLYPLHLATLLVVTALNLAALRVIGYTPVYANFDLFHFVAQLFMASNWTEMMGLSFNGPIWSVSAEILIYAIFWRSRKLIARFGLPLVAAMIAGFYFALSSYGVMTKAFECGFYFFWGCGLLMIHRSPWGAGKRLAVPVLLLSGIAILGMDGGGWAFRYMILPGLAGATFMVLAAVEQHTPAMLGGIFRWLGESSYGIYLWHFPVQLALLLAIAPFGKSEAIAQDGWFLFLYVFATLASARLGYRLLERPARSWVRRRLGRRPAMHMGVTSGTSEAMGAPSQ